MEFLPITIDGGRVHAGFWKRFCAGWVDAFVILPLAFSFIWLEGFDRTLAIVITIPSTVLFGMYNVYFNARFGGTLGKLALGIRVARPNGESIGWIEAWKRSAVDLGFAVVMLIIEVWALSQINAAEYAAAAFVERMGLLKEHYPPWRRVITVGHQVWIWGELIVLLSNARRRALHDFIAGTVVIHKEFVGVELEDSVC